MGLFLWLPFEGNGNSGEEINQEVFKMVSLAVVVAMFVWSAFIGPIAFPIGIALLGMHWASKL